MKVIYALSYLLLFFLSSCHKGIGSGGYHINGMSIIIIIIFVALIIVAIKSEIKKKSKIARKKEVLSDIADENCNITAQVDGFRGNFKFIVDEKAGEVIIIYSASDIQKIPFINIIGAEVLINGMELYAKSINDTLGNAVDGKIDRGHDTPFINILSDPTRFTTKVSKIAVKIRLNSFTESSIFLVCYDAWEATDHTKKEISPTETGFRIEFCQGLAAANRIKELIDVILDKKISHQNNDSNSPVTTSNPAHDNSSSIVEDLQKLAKLKEEGHITYEEYNTIKSKILKMK